MISFLLADSKKEETKGIENAVRPLAALHTNEHWEYHILNSLSQCTEYTKSKPLIHFCCFDYLLDENTNYLSGFRKNYEQMQLMLIADKSVSPYKYLKPGIRPDSVLLRPFGNNDLTEVMEEFVSSGVNRLFGNQSDSAFLIANKDENILLEYNNIFYFEAREKKIYARTLKEEYGFYKTLDELQEELPDGFIRCHRSYIVNVALIKKINTSTNLLELKEGFTIPLSRSYKPILKDKIREYEQ